MQELILKNSHPNKEINDIFLSNFVGIKSSELWHQRDTSGDITVSKLI